MSWKLLQVCIEYLEENESNWKKRKVEIEKERSRIEKKEKAAIMSKDAKIKHIQKKITESLIKLPEKERYRIEREEEIERRHDLKRIKEDLWKLRGKRSKDKSLRKDLTETGKLLNKLEKIKEAWDNIEEEKKIEKERKDVYEKKIMKLIEEKRLREEAKLREKEKKSLRLDRAKKLDQKWEMTK